jgi:hypothetical protein
VSESRAAGENADDRYWPFQPACVLNARIKYRDTCADVNPTLLPGCRLLETLDTTQAAFAVNHSHDCHRSLWGGDVFADSAFSYSGWLMRDSNWAGLRYSMLECFLSKL